MNRRDFVKALAGIPLLGLLARLSKTPKPIIVDAIKEIVDREGWGPATSFVDGNICGETACYSFAEPRLMVGSAGGYITMDPDSDVVVYINDEMFLRCNPGGIWQRWAGEDWQVVILETTQCAYMTNGESVVFDPPVVAGGDFIDLYEIIS